jgi:hypothetical protein
MPRGSPSLEFVAAFGTPTPPQRRLSDSSNPGHGPGCIVQGRGPTPRAPAPGPFRTSCLPPLNSLPSTPRPPPEPATGASHARDLPASASSPPPTRRPLHRPGRPLSLSSGAEGRPVRWSGACGAAGRKAAGGLPSWPPQPDAAGLPPRASGSGRPERARRPHPVVHDPVHAHGGVLPPGPQRTGVDRQVRGAGGRRGPGPPGVGRDACRGPG